MSLLTLLRWRAPLIIQDLDQPPIQPGAFSAISRGSTTIASSPFIKRRNRQRRELEMVFLSRS